MLLSLHKKVISNLLGDRAYSNCCQCFIHRNSFSYQNGSFWGNSVVPEKKKFSFLFLRALIWFQIKELWLYQLTIFYIYTYVKSSSSKTWLPFKASPNAIDPSSPKPFHAKLIFFIYTLFWGKDEKKYQQYQIRF